MQIWTVNEQDCYDKGFENAKDYWIPLEQHRIIKLLEKQKKIYNNPKYSTTGGLIEEFVLDSAIALIKGEAE